MDTSKTVIYRRVSDLHQLTTETLEEQTKKCQGYCTENGIEVFEIYSDANSSENKESKEEENHLF
jgi:DNA invertase Pin-like site-specific DNA recombinase